MKSRFLIALALLVAAPASAVAQDVRFTDARYLAASRCVAYAELPQLQADAFDIAGLKQTLGVQRVEMFIRDRARADARSVRLAGVRARDNARAIETLRYRRDNACANFVSSGLVQAGAVNPAS